MLRWKPRNDKRKASNSKDTRNERNRENYKYKIIDLKNNYYITINSRKNRYIARHSRKKYRRRAI